MMKSICVLIVVAIAFINSSLGVDYCNIKSCNPKSSHTVCRFQKSGASPRCTGDQGGGLNDDQRKEILNKHNELRQKVASGNERRGSNGPQPAAKGMPNLQWDRELELVAQRWADQCNWGHDSCRDVERFSVGQNIGEIGTTENLKDIKLVSFVQSWYDEVQFFNRNQVSRLTTIQGSGNKDVGHYTQIVWAKTTKIGCGVRKYRKGIFNTLYLVCNYGPAGNYIGEPVYQAR